MLPYINLMVRYCWTARVVLFSLKNIGDPSIILETPAIKKLLMPNSSTILNFLGNNLKLLGNLTHFRPVSHFYTPWKHQKMRGGCKKGTLIWNGLIYPVVFVAIVSVSALVDLNDVLKTVINWLTHLYDYVSFV